MKIRIKTTLPHSWVKLLILFLLTAVGSSEIVFAQDVIRVNNIKGVGVISGNITERQALQYALSDAKSDALIEAGVTEHIQVYELIYRTQVNNEFSELFNTDILAEMQGAVKNYEIVSQNRKLNPSTNLFEIEIVINADVIIYETKADPAFKTIVDGVKSIYENGETLQFSVTSAIDAHLTIFNISDEQTILLYPNQWEKEMVLNARKHHAFPFGEVDYYTSKKNEEAFEINRLIFVFTKEPIPFLPHKTEQQITSFDDVLSWIYSIPPDQRNIEYQSFTIR